MYLMTYVFEISGSTHREQGTKSPPEKTCCLLSRSSKFVGYYNLLLGALFVFLDLISTTLEMDSRASMDTIRG